MQSPGAKILYDTLSHNKLKSYVKGVVGKFANDSRILAWDLYNEPAQHNGAPRVSKERVFEIYKVKCLKKDYICTVVCCLRQLNKLSSGGLFF